MTSPSYIIPNLKGEPTFANNIPGFRSLVGPEQWHYAPELMPQVLDFLSMQQGDIMGKPMRPTLVGETLHIGDWVIRATVRHPVFMETSRVTAVVRSEIAYKAFEEQHWVCLTTRPMPEPPNAASPLIEKIEQLLTYPMDNRARVLLTLALDIERGKATAQ